MQRNRTGPSGSRSAAVRAVVAATVLLGVVGVAAGKPNSFGYYSTSGQNKDYLSDFRHSKSQVKFEEYPTSSTCADGVLNAQHRYYAAYTCISRSSTTSEYYEAAGGDTAVTLKYYASSAYCSGTPATTTFTLDTCAADANSVGRKLVATGAREILPATEDTTGVVGLYHWERGTGCNIRSGAYPYYAAYGDNVCYALSASTSVKAQYVERDWSILYEYSASAGCTGAVTAVALVDRLWCNSNTALWTEPERASKAQTMLALWLTFTVGAPLVAMVAVATWSSTVLGLPTNGLGSSGGVVVSLLTSPASLSAGQSIAIFPGLVFFYLMLYFYGLPAWAICLIGVVQVPVYSVCNLLATVMPLGFGGAALAMSPPGFALYHLFTPHQMYLMFVLFVGYATGSVVAATVVGAAVGLLLPGGFPWIFGIHAIIFADTVMGKWAVLLVAAAYCELFPLIGHLPANILLSCSLAEIGLDFELLMLLLAVQYLVLLPVAGYPLAVIFYSIFLSYSSVPAVGVLTAAAIISAAPGGFVLGWVLFLVWVYEGIPG